MYELLLNRRSIRKYKNKKVENEKLERILRCTLLSPSSRSLRPWEFIVVKDKNTIKELAKAKEHGSAFLENAPVAIVVIADSSKCDVWIEDTSIASIIMQLEAEKSGLGSCWIQIRKRKTANGEYSEEYVKKTLNVPANYHVESIIAIGYSDEAKESYKFEDLMFEKVHRDTYKYN